MTMDEFELVQSRGGEEVGLSSFYSDEEEVNSQRSYNLSQQTNPTTGPYKEGGFIPLPVTQPLRYFSQTRVLKLLLPTISLLSLWLTHFLSLFVTKTLFTADFILFPNPLFLSWLQQVFIFLVLFIVGELSNSRFQVVSNVPKLQLDGDTLRKVVPLSLVYLSMAVSSNLCLFYNQATYYQVAVSLSVIFTLLLEKIMLNRTASPGQLATGLVLAVGFVLASTGDTRLKPLGLVSGVGFGFSAALYGIYTKKTLAQVNNEWVLLQYNSGLSIVVTLPLLLVSGELVRVAYTPAIANPLFWLASLGTSLSLCLTQVASTVQPRFVSSLAVTTSSITKETLQAILAALLFRVKVSPLLGLGLTLIILGLGSGTYLKLIETTRNR